MTDEGTKIPVPDWVLKNIFRSRGIRLPKRPTVVEVQKAHDHAVVIFPGPGSGGRFVSYGSQGVRDTRRGLPGFLPPSERHVPRIIQATDIPSTDRFAVWQAEQKLLRAAADQRMRGNLPREDYRWWIGAEMNLSDWALCRYCRQCYYGADARKTHQGISALDDSVHCKIKLAMAYRKLRERNQCAMCGNVTARDVWGVPICGEICETKWMFQVTEPLWVGKVLNPRVPLKGGRIVRA